MLQNISGNNVIVYMNTVDGLMPMFCGKDCVFTEEKELIEASTVTSGIWKEYRLRKRSWTMQITGLTKINNLDAQVSYFDIISDSINMESQSISITFTDDINFITRTVSGSAFITDSNINGPVDDLDNAAVNFIGDGNYTVT